MVKKKKKIIFSVPNLPTESGEMVWFKWSDPTYTSTYTTWLTFEIQFKVLATVPRIYIEYFEFFKQFIWGHLTDFTLRIQNCIWNSHDCVLFRDLSVEKNNFTRSFKFCEILTTIKVVEIKYLNKKCFNFYWISTSQEVIQSTTNSIFYRWIKYF